MAMDSELDEIKMISSVLEATQNANIREDTETPESFEKITGKIFSSRNLKKKVK